MKKSLFLTEHNNNKKKKHFLRFLFSCNSSSNPDRKQIHQHCCKVAEDPCPVCYRKYRRPCSLELGGWRMAWPTRYANLWAYWHGAGTRTVPLIIKNDSVTQYEFYTFLNCIWIFYITLFHLHKNHLTSPVKTIWENDNPHLHIIQMNNELNISWNRTYHQLTQIITAINKLQSVWCHIHIVLLCYMLPQF